MDEIYKWGYNPLKDFLFQLILNNYDISKDEVFNEIELNIINMLTYLGIDEHCLKFLDFEIRKKDNHFKVISNNIVTAMWFSGAYINDCSFAIDNNSVTFENRKYRFNKKTKKLTWKEKK